MTTKLKDKYDIQRKEITEDETYAKIPGWAVTVDDRMLAWFRYRADANIFFNWCTKVIKEDSTDNWKTGKGGNYKTTSGKQDPIM